MQNEVKALLIGVAAGITGGLVGLGGGIIMVPGMVHILRFSQHAAHATSLAAMAPLAISSALVYSSYGNLDIVIAALLSVGGMAGAYIGSSLMPYVKPNTLKRLLAVLTLAVSIKMGCFS